MSELKDEWKEAGKDFGRGFKGLGKTIAKSAKHIVNKASSEDKNEPKPVDNGEAIDVKDISEATSETEKVEAEDAKESTVFSDGSWRETGKGLGKGFGGMGKMIGKTLSKPFKKSKKEEPVKETEIKQIK